MSRWDAFVDAGLRVVVNYAGTLIFSSMGLLAAAAAVFAAVAGVDRHEVLTLVRAACVLLVLALPVCYAVEHAMCPDENEGDQDQPSSRSWQQGS